MDCMRKVVIIGLMMVIAFGLFLVSNQEVYAEGEHLMETSQVLLDFLNVKDVMVLSYKDNAILYQTTDNLGFTNVNLMVAGKLRLTYSLNVTAFYDDLNTFYVAGTKNNNSIVISIDKSNYKVKEIIIDLDTINDLQKDGDTWVLVGSKNSDAAIIVTNQNFEKLRSQNYGGEGKESYQKVLISSDDYLVVGEKDAHSFINVGNLGEQKVFLSKISKDLNTVNHQYLNFQESIEQIISIINISDQNLLLIKASNKYYLTCFSSDFEYEYSLNLNDLYNFEIKDVNIVKGYRTYLITVFRKGSKFYYGVIDSATSKAISNYSINVEGKLLKASITSGLLEIITFNNNKLILNQIDNYEEDIRPLVMNKEYSPIEELDTLNVASYFGEVKVERKAITPYFSNSISGNYQASFEVTLPSGRKLLKTRLITVSPYVNVVNGGIYPTNYTLDFFDYGKLNGVSIPRNKKITSPGSYTLTLTNNIGEVQTINFLVVDNFLKSSSDNIQEVDYVLPKGEAFTFELPFKTSGIVESIVINGNQYNNFTYENNKIKLTLSSPLVAGVYPYIIEYVNVNYLGKTYPEEVGQIIMVRVPKDLPEISITTRDQKEFIFHINDSDQTLMDLVVCVYDQGQLISSISSALQNKEVVASNLVPEHRCQFKLKVLYHLGNGKIEEVTLVEWEAVASSSDIKVGKLSILKQQQVLEEASFKLLMNDKDIHKLKVASTELTPVSNNINYQWILAGVLMVVVAIVLAFFINCRKRKVNVHS